MTGEQMLYAAAAVAGAVVLTWDWLVAAGDYLLKSVPGPGREESKPRRAVGPTYQEAIADLASVRLRLIGTDGLTDPAKAAIDTLTLALVAGSDK
jgi:hypothetical protein